MQLHLGHEKETDHQSHGFARQGRDSDRTAAQLCVDVLQLRRFDEGRRAHPCSSAMCEVRAHPVRKRGPAVTVTDGFRVQAHKLGDDVELYSRSGSRFSRRVPRLVSVLGELPTRSASIDGEIVASDVASMPDFWPQFLRSAKPAELHVWALNLLALDGKDLRKLPLETRQRRLQVLLNRFACPTVLASEAFAAAPSGREAWPGRRGKQASERALQVRCMPRVAQDQDDGLA
jgi:ATP dependent DNA ligase domain